MASLTRIAPISLFLREDAKWLCAKSPEIDLAGLSSPAGQIVDLLESRGAMFASDLLIATQMLNDHLDDALGELVTRGILTADGFAGLRALVGEKPTASRRLNRQKVERKRTTKAAVGRWSIRPDANIQKASEDPPPKRTTQPAPSTAINEKRSDQKLAEDWAWQLLRRWGVVYRDLLEREDGTPSWYEILQVLRRLEARGEIRGGRFISDVAGEQFALADSIQQLRRLRDEGPTQELVVISAADPLNLVGIITRNERIPRTASNRVAYLDGVCVACLQGGEVRWFSNVSRELMPAILDRLRQKSILCIEPNSSTATVVDSVTIDAVN